MAIIDPKGLFNGDRLRQCSNAARLYWPYLFLASNGYARIEINFPKLITTVFGTFNPRPQQRDLEGCFLEYAENRLIFVYESDGQLWGQWDTPERLLKSYKTEADRRSPAPPVETLQCWRQEYESSKSASVVSENFRKSLGVLPESTRLQEICPSFGKEKQNSSLGVGVGDGKDKEKSNTSSSFMWPKEAVLKKLMHESSKRDAPDSRHVLIRELIHRLHLERFKVEVQWDGSEAKALDRLLRSNPAWSVEQFSVMVTNRFDSEGVTSARPRKWIPSLGDYAAGSQDRYGRALGASSVQQKAALNIRRNDPFEEVVSPSMPLPAELHDGEVVWRELKESLGKVINKHSFETWISPLRPLGIYDRRLFLRIPTREFTHVREKFADQISAAMPPGIGSIELVCYEAVTQ